VTTEEGAALAEELGMPFLETSARTAENVDSAFFRMAELLLKARCVWPRQGIVGRGGEGGATVQLRDRASCWRGHARASPSRSSLFAVARLLQDGSATTSAG
jgi:hypothetical protein